MKAKRERPNHVLYLAVLPAYRQECINLLLQEAPETHLACSTAHLDRSVTTGIRTTQYTRVNMIRFGRKLFLQCGDWRFALTSQTLVVDLNPRSMTSWIFLLLRGPTRGRTLVWGHLHPQQGPDSRSAGLRRAMRRASDGIVTYTYDNKEQADQEVPRRPTWVAPNALYSRQQLEQRLADHLERRSFLYVGRFAPAKKVELAIHGFAESGLGPQGARLTLVGGGQTEDDLRRLVSELKVGDFVQFTGWVDDIHALAAIYGTAVSALSPGFAGLGLTQALGFGVPVIVAKDEPHSPEIELSRCGGVEWFESDNSSDLALAMRRMWRHREMLPVKSYQEYISRMYSADQMAAGLLAALEGTESNV